MNLADSDLGQILVGGDGRTLYLFEQDTSDTASTCSGDCAGDSAPGDTTGNDVDQFGAEWYAMTAAGESVGDDDESSGEDSDDNSSTTTSSGSSGSLY